MKVSDVKKMSHGGGERVENLPKRFHVLFECHLIIQ
jgi:hypothetical protein